MPAIEPPKAERNATMRAAVAHGEHTTIVPPAQNQRNIEQYGLGQFAGPQLGGS
jgi:hypothetical protein